MTSEQIVLSIPAAPSIHLVEAFNVYACPSGRDRHRKTRYVAFRAEGGVMSHVWRIHDVRRVDLALKAECNGLSHEEWSKVRGYLAGYALFGKVHPGPHRFYFLGEQPVYSLAHGPRVQRNNAYKCYFRLTDLRDYAQPIVSPVPSPLLPSPTR